MSTGTTLVALKQALVTKLRARAGLSGVQVLYAIDDFEPGDDHLRNEAIWLGNAKWLAPDGSNIANMRAGTKKIDEVYELELFVQVLKDDGSTQEAADVRAEALLAEVQQQFAETPQITPQVFWAEERPREHIIGQLPTGPGHGARFERVVWAKARLAP